MSVNGLFLVRRAVDISYVLLRLGFVTFVQSLECKINKQTYVAADLNLPPFINGDNLGLFNYEKDTLYPISTARVIRKRNFNPPSLFRGTILSRRRDSEFSSDA